MSCSKHKINISSKSIVKVKKMFDNNKNIEQNIYSIYKETRMNYETIRKVLEYLLKVGYIEYNIITKMYKKMEKNDWVE